jgi:hypothetical protein
MMKMTIAEDKDADRIQSAAERGIVHHKKIEFAESEMGQNEKSAFFGLMSASSSCGY